MEDCSPKNRTNVDGMVHGEFCEEIENHILKELGPRGMWSGESPGSSRVWLVLHRMAVEKYPWTKTDRHPLLVIAEPRYTPQCEMWVLVRNLQHETALEQETSPSFPLSPVLTELPPQSLQALTSTTANVLVHASGSSHATAMETHNTHSPGTLRPPSFTRPTHFAAPKPLISPAEEQPPSLGSHRTSPQASGHTKQPSKTDSLGPAKQQAQAKASARSAACSNAPSRDPAPKRPCGSAAAQPQGPLRPGASACLRAGNQWNLTPLIRMQKDSKVNVACVLVEVEKAGSIARNNVKYDIIKVTARELVHPSSPRTSIMVKIFHNDKLEYSGVTLERGQVLLLREMLVSAGVGFAECCSSDKHLFINFYVLIIYEIRISANSTTLC